MISELLDLADRLEIPTPRAFERMPVHYFIDLDAEGKLLGITPAYGRTNDKTGEPELGKLMDCPVYFAISLGKDGKIQGAGGGGKSVPEAGHGDVREIFCSVIKGSPAKPVELKPTGAQVQALENSMETASDLEEDDSESEDDAASDAKGAKRHENWLRRMQQFFDSAPQTTETKALQAFFGAKHRLSHEQVLKHFQLPDPTKAEVSESDPDEKKKAKAKATKQRNAQLGQVGKSRFTFRVGGQILLKKNSVFWNWWKKTYEKERDTVLAKLPLGSDPYSAQDNVPLTPRFPRIDKIPNGGNYCPLSSVYSATTKSFGLAEHTVSMSLVTAERAAAALNWLLSDKNSHCRLGENLVAVFWAVPPAKDTKPCPHDFAALMNEPDALQVLSLFKNIHGHAATTPDTAQFYCAILSSPKSRITVRGWLTQTLGRVTESAEAYFRAVSLPNVFRAGELTASTIGEMAAATIPPKAKSAPPSAVYARILQTALFGTLLPHVLLEKALARQALELAKGCAEKKERSDFESRLRARTALIKLYFYSNQKEPKDKSMNEHHHDKQDHPAYLCGRVLALLDKIHNAAHGKSTASSPAGRYYGSASSTPALVFPRLCKLANIHLEKIGGGMAYKLQHGVPKDKAETPIERDFEGLAQLIARFSADAKWPRTLSLEDQGRFAIGFYYEKCRKWPRYRKGANPKVEETGDTDDPINDTNETDDSDKSQT